MKLKVATIAAAMLVAATAHADISVAWSTPSGFTMPDGTTPILASGSALFQLIYSVDSTAGDANTDGTAIGDSVLAQAVVDQSGGDPYGAFFADTYSSAFTAGFVYIRVFEDGTGLGSTPIGSWYFTGPVVALVDTAPPPALAQNVTAGLAGSGSGDFGTIILNQQVPVPEPGVLAFLGIGSLLMVVRRMRRS